MHFLVCVCVVGCNWVNSRTNASSELLQAYVKRPTCLSSKWIKAFPVLMPLAKSIGFFQTLNITSNEPGRVSGVTSRSRISFSGSGKKKRKKKRKKGEENRSQSWIGSSSDSKFSFHRESFRLADGILGDTSLLIGFFRLRKHGVTGYRILQRKKTTRDDINLLGSCVYNEATGTLCTSSRCPWSSECHSFALDILIICQRMITVRALDHARHKVEWKRGPPIIQSVVTLFFWLLC